MASLTQWIDTQQVVALRQLPVSSAKGKINMTALHITHRDFPDNWLLSSLSIADFKKASVSSGTPSDWEVVWRLP